MEGKNPSNTESSLLFRLPNSMMSFTDMSASPVLMPVAVDKTEDTQNVPVNASSSATSQLCKTMPTICSQSICQLEQPLMVRKTSASSISSVPSSTVLSYPTDAYSETPSGASIYTQCQAPGNISDKPLKSVADYPLPQTSVPSYGFYNQTPSSTYSYSPNPSSYENESTQSTFFVPHDRSHSCGNSFEPTHQYQIPTPSGTYESTPQYQVPGQIPATAVDGHQQQIHSAIQSPSTMYYTPPKPHWLFEDTIESKEVWYAFSDVDSDHLEEALQRGTQNIVPSDGGRYDVHIDLRVKKSIYFDAKDLKVRRGTWFYEVSSTRFKPYTEEVSAMLEQHYFSCISSGKWQKHFNIPGVGNFVYENAQILLHYKNEFDVWPALPDSKASPKAVKRNLPDGFEILPNESAKIDHLVFIVQGIGSFCDLRFRTVAQCVDGFRDIANKLIGSHFKAEVEQGRVGRVEFLPVAWHSKLHTSEVGLDKRMQNITLPSIPKLRHFTNDTLIDILLYSSPSYCQSILDTVACEMNKLYDIFLSRNPNFSGKVCVSGHSLGSLILFDILSNQNLSENVFHTGISNETNVEPPTETPNCQNASNKFSSIESLLQSLDLSDYIDTFKEERIDFDSLELLSDEDLKALGVPLGPRTKLLNLIAEKKNISKDFVSGPVANTSIDNLKNESFDCQNTLVYPSQSLKSGMSFITYPRLNFEPEVFFALGSPISMFLAVRGYDTISETFQFPTCPSFFHIFHPYDPVAFRIETLIDPSFTAKPVLIPHHKGRKRMHLEIKDNVSKIASEIKQRLMDTMRYTWNSVSEFAKNHAFPSAILEAEVDKLVEQEMAEPLENQDASCDNISIGCLNNGRRIDYVLQEKPIEALNDYVFALTSHATYWDSDDTVLMTLREIYARQGIYVSPPTDSKAGIQSRDNSSYLLPFDVVTSTGPSTSYGSQTIFTPPESNVPTMAQPIFPITEGSGACTAASPLPISGNPPPSAMGPPPLSGFVKRSAFMR